MPRSCPTSSTIHLNRRSEYPFYFDGEPGSYYCDELMIANAETRYNSIARQDFQIVRRA